MNDTNTLAAAVATARTHLDAVVAKRDAYRRTHNEGGAGFNPYEERVIEAVDALRAARLAEYASRWEELRAAWNAGVAKYSVNGQLAMRDLKKIEAEVGVSRADLVAVKKMVEG